MSPIPMKHNITYPYEALNTQHYKTAEQSNNYKENRVYEQLRSFIKMGVAMESWLAMSSHVEFWRSN